MSEIQQAITRPDRMEGYLGKLVVLGGSILLAIFLAEAFGKGTDMAKVFDVGLAPAVSFTGGWKTLAAAATAEPLVSVSTPCKGVWLGARVNADGGAVNTKPVFVGSSVAKAVYNQGAIPIMPDNVLGIVIRIDDAKKVFVKAGVNGEGVAFQIFL